MRVELEEEVGPPIPGFVAYPRCTLLVQFEPGEVMNADVKQRVRELRYSAQAAWERYYGGAWYGPVQ